MDVFAIINPISGVGANHNAASRRVAMLRSAAERRHLRIDIRLTERAGHAKQMAARAVASGVRQVIAWGGDGTINEVGCSLLETSTVLGVIPAGSGNGLAAALALPRRDDLAIETAFDGDEWTIDAGMLAGRPFFNIAGVGFDAHVARLFNARPPGRRGGLPYVTIGVREGCRYRATEYSLSLDGQPCRLQALLIAFANGREYGMGARISPQAQLDDGLLDATVVEDRSVVARFLSIPYLALAVPHRAPGVAIHTVKNAVIEAEGPMDYHVDGEPGTVSNRIEVKIVPRALKVRVPAGTRKPSARGSRRWVSQWRRTSA